MTSHQCINYELLCFVRAIHIIIVTVFKRLRDLNGLSLLETASTGGNRGNNRESTKAKLVNNAQKIKSIGTMTNKTHSSGGFRFNGEKIR